MAEILLTAFNARYAHTAFGLRSIMANLGDLQSATKLLEFDLQVAPRVALERMLVLEPKIIGIGCYIWNIDLVTSVAALLKMIRPDITLVLGGPEISFETEKQEVSCYADFIICGEGEIEFRRLCRELLLGRRDACDTANSTGVRRDACDTGEVNTVPQASRLHSKESKPRIIQAKPVDVTEIELPYSLYSDADIAHRAIYVEASRGCPFRCEYCMSSLDETVRYYPKKALFEAFDHLLQRGARLFKFVDRTFNLDIDYAVDLLQFFMKKYQPGMMLHFEMIPERLPARLLDAVKQCPAGMLQFEIGIQTFNEQVAHRIQRPLNIDKIEANLKTLREETSVHLHADLIAGLPGEDLESFTRGFDRLLALNPQEIQLGILKRLRGAPIDRHTIEWAMLYSPYAPYEVVQTSCISFVKMQKVSRFARFWNITVNNGQFVYTAPLLWANKPSAFEAFMGWSNWLYEQTNSTGNIALLRLAKLLLQYLTKNGYEEHFVAESIWKDYQRGNRPDVPGFLKTFGFGPINDLSSKVSSAGTRQRRHRT